MNELQEIAREMIVYGKPQDGDPLERIRDWAYRLTDISAQRPSARVERIATGPDITHTEIDSLDGVYDLPPGRHLLYAISEN